MWAGRLSRFRPGRARATFRTHGQRLLPSFESRLQTDLKAARHEHVWRNGDKSPYILDIGFTVWPAYLRGKRPQNPFSMRQKGPEIWCDKLPRSYYWNPTRIYNLFISQVLTLNERTITNISDKRKLHCTYNVQTQSLIRNPWDQTRFGNWNFFYFGMVVRGIGVRSLAKVLHGLSVLIGKYC
jgi:hypothetical protein